MESNHHRHRRHVFSLSVIPCIFLFFFAIFFSPVSSDINGDKEKCANQLVGLATCLPYVSGDAKTPTVDCCSGLKEVLKNSKECLCILVKDRNDPSLGLKINATLALSLPDKCHVPANVGDVSQCPALLHLPPNSPDAKVFEDFAHGTNATHTSGPPAAGGVGDSTAKGSSTAAGQKSDGGKTRLKIGVVSGFLFAFLLVHVS